MTVLTSLATSSLLVAALLDGPAQAVEPHACDDYGYHAAVLNSSQAYMEGTYPRSWVAPGVTYTISVGTSTTVSGTVTTTVGADFAEIVSVQLGVSVGMTRTATVTETFSWTNTTSETRWAQLGSMGMSFDYDSYDVNEYCAVVNETMGHAVLPTGQPYFNHS
jgi:hypothetical protein